MRRPSPRVGWTGCVRSTWEATMALIRSAILACSAVLGATLPAHATFQVIYDVLGVYDDGAGPGLGSATVMHCSNVGFNAVNVRVRAIRADGAQAGNVVT